MVIRKGLQWRSCLFFGFLSQGSGRQPGGCMCMGDNAMPLEVSSKEKEPGVCVVQPVGSLDSNTYMILQEHLHTLFAQSCPDIIIFDMEGVNFISSMGVRVIVKTGKRLREKDGKLLVSNLRPQIRMVFDIIRALPPERIFTSLQELDDYLAHMQRKTVEKG